MVQSLLALLADCHSVEIKVKFLVMECTKKLVALNYIYSLTFDSGLGGWEWYWFFKVKFSQWEKMIITPLYKLINNRPMRCLSILEQMDNNSVIIHHCTDSYNCWYRGCTVVRQWKVGTAVTRHHWPWPSGAYMSGNPQSTYQDSRFNSWSLLSCAQQLHGSCWQWNS